MLTALGVTGAAEDPLLDIVISNVQYRVQNKTNRKDTLGVNGVMDDLHRKFLELPTDPPEE